MTEAVPFPSRPVSKPSPAPSLDPEHRVAVLRFHREAELHLNFLCPADELKNLFRFLRKPFELSRKTRQRLIEGDELVSVFFQELAACLEREPSITGGQQREEKLRAITEASQSAGDRRGPY